MEARKVLAEALKLQREQTGMTQEELAEALADEGMEIHPTTLGRTENETRGMRVEELLALAAALGVSPRELVAPLYGRTLTLGDRELTAAQVLEWFAGDAGALDRSSTSLGEIRDETRNRRLLADLREEVAFLHKAFDECDRAAAVWGISRTHATLAHLTERTMTDDELSKVWRDHELREES